jgi:hypothetical protein
MFAEQVMVSCVGRWIYHKDTALLLKQVNVVTSSIMYSDSVHALWFAHYASLSCTWAFFAILDTLEYGKHGFQNTNFSQRKLPHPGTSSSEDQTHHVRMRKRANVSRWHRKLVHKVNVLAATYMQLVKYHDISVHNGLHSHKGTNQFRFHISRTWKICCFCSFVCYYCLCLRVHILN